MELRPQLPVCWAYRHESSHLALMHTQVPTVSQGYMLGYIGEQDRKASVLSLHSSSEDGKKSRRVWWEAGVCFTPWLKYFDLFESLLREIYSVLQRALEGSA